MDEDDPVAATVLVDDGVKLVVIDGDIDPVDELLERGELLADGEPEEKNDSDAHADAVEETVGLGDIRGLPLEETEMNGE